MSAVPVLPEGFATRPLVASDAPAVTALVAACELHDDGEVAIEEQDVVAEWQQPSMDLGAHTVGVFLDGQIVAGGEVFLGRRADVYVHPDHRARGLGTALMRWTWECARAGGSSLIGQTVGADNAGAVALFRRHGYAPLWTSWVLRIELDREPPDPDLPPGYSIRTFVPGRDDRAAYQVIEDAFNEWPDRDPTTYGDWAASTTGRPGFEAWQLALACEGRNVVGACFMIPYDDEGWVHQIAVEKASRGRGLARALLQHSFGVFWDRGERRCGLSTDSRTGALGLYEHVGMRVRRTYVHWAKSL